MERNSPDLFLSEDQKSRHIYSVSEITRDIQVILENTFHGLWVEGEVSNFKAHSSGHFYFSLKDKDAVLAAAMFSRANKDIKFKIEDGLKAVCFGKINVYSPRGQYQLIVEKMEPQGIGAQQLALEQLKKKLAKEGLFDPGRKRPLTLMPFSVGIVTSGSGAAVRDILQILKRGASCVDVILRSVRVQGESAAQEIAEGINDFNKFKKVDAIIVSRGGGSIEDLWAFNEEAVVRAIAASEIPVVSAVGHQINLTLADLAADIFVETPTAAAKIMVDKKNTLLADIDSFKHEMEFSVQELFASLNNRLATLRHSLKSPWDRLSEKAQLVDELSAALKNNMVNYLKLIKERASAYIQRLEALSPLAVLSRGYSLSMLMPETGIIKNAARLKKGDKIKTVLEKGSFLSTVEEVIKDERETDI
ncbi:MAG: exodeoxyribonuclease VII large subunit [Candidatus Omnitrophota bacterium]|nr:exodeoxyribonuclease VII large subunit [Candidatus Omnitrophota bacterium]